MTIVRCPKCKRDFTLHSLHARVLEKGLQVRCPLCDRQVFFWDREMFLKASLLIVEPLKEKKEG